MQDYQPISLTEFCNVNAEIIGSNATPTFEGINLGNSPISDVFTTSGAKGL